MYLSRLYIRNFRSINELDLCFQPGKNVVIGRNNCGKSNIVRAIDLVLGDSSPTYARSENITPDDFFTWSEPKASGEQPVLQSANEILIWCELTREVGEILNYDEIYSCYGYKVYSDIVGWNDRKPTKVPHRIDKDLLPGSMEAIFDIDEDQAQTHYVNPKLRNQRTYEEQFEPCTQFGYAFRALRDECGRIDKDIRFLYREGDGHDWIMAFSASVRTEFLQSAIIPSFRDPQTQLRLTPWNWYGKLMRHLVAKHGDSPDLLAAFEKVREVSGTIFVEVQKELDESTLNVAFPGTALSIQLGADTKTNIYKNSVIYVDDGFRSPLTEKGAGIQSATVIGLFNYFTHNVNTTGSALLCVEEPELYLQPSLRTICWKGAPPCLTLTC